MLEAGHMPISKLSSNSYKEGGQIKSISEIKTGHLPGRNTNILVLNPELWLLKVLIKAVMSDVLHIVTVNTGTQLMAVS